MEIFSPNFENNMMIPAIFSANGKNINPALQISEVAENAKSLVLIMDDPDAPSGDFVHWLLWNIDPTAKEITENSVPDDAIEGTNSAGRIGYTGPRPPSGTHHYQFKLYALDMIINLPSSTNKEELERAMSDHIIDRAQLIGLYTKM